MSARRSPASLQADVLAFIKMFTRLEGRAPSNSEIGRGIGADKSGAARVVARLRSRGLLDRGGPRVKGGRVGELQIVHDQSFQAEARQ